MITYYTYDGKFEISNYWDCLYIPYDKLHRIDGPALIWKNGEKHWYVNGKLHRLDGPAYIGNDSTQEWWIKGKIIKREFPDGYTEYYWNGKGGLNILAKTKYHRDPSEGPAIIFPDGRCEYWVKGQLVELSGKQLKELAQKINLNQEISSTNNLIF